MPDEVLGLGGLGGGAGAEPLEVGESGASVEQGVPGPPVVGEDERDVEPGLPGAEQVAAGLLVAECLLVLAQRGTPVPDIAVEVAELIFDGGAVVVVVLGQQVQGLLVAGAGLFGMLD